MKFVSENELDKFGFQDAQIVSFESLGKELLIVLEAVVVKARNSQNTNFTDSYAGTLQMRLIDGEIQKAVKEGYKYYDANDVLVEEVPDTPLSKAEISSLMKRAKDFYLFDMVPVEQDQNTTGQYLYLMGIDEDDETSYWFQVTFSKSILEWDKYMNRVQNV